MSDLSDFYLKSRASIIELETLEITHPSFTRTYRVVRNRKAGLVATLETAEVVAFDYYPLKVTSLGSRDDLDQSLRIDLGDLGEILPRELDAVQSSDGYSIKPVVVYRTYRSDLLTQPLFGPLYLEVRAFSFKREGSSFEAKAPELNDTRTGEVYRLDRFPMLRGFL